MAAIDEKMAALAFQVTTSRTPEQLVQAVGDAAEIASSGGEKITLNRPAPNRFDAVAKNFIRVTHAVFSVTFDATGDGQTRVSLTIGDYMRTRQTLLVFIPVSPWSAPAYKTLKTFSEYLRGRL